CRNRGRGRRRAVQRARSPRWSGGRSRSPALLLPRGDPLQRLLAGERGGVVAFAELGEIGRAQQQLLDHIIDRAEDDRGRDVLAALAVLVAGRGHAVAAAPEQHDAVALQGGGGDRGEIVRSRLGQRAQDRKSTRLNSSHVKISYAV